MNEFDESKIFTSLNADKLKLGSKIIAGDNILYLYDIIKNNRVDFFTTSLLEVLGKNNMNRFRTIYGAFNLCYLIEEPEENILKWTELNIGDVIRVNANIQMVTGICSKDSDFHIFAEGRWLSDKELESWEKVEKENENNKIKL